MFGVVRCVAALNTKLGDVSGMLCDADTNFNPFGSAPTGYCRCMDGGARACS